eukprot:UN3073
MPTEWYKALRADQLLTSPTEVHLEWQPADRSKCTHGLEPALMVHCASITRRLWARKARRLPSACLQGPRLARVAAPRHRKVGSRLHLERGQTRPAAMCQPLLRIGRALSAGSSWSVPPHTSPRWRRR